MIFRSLFVVAAIYLPTGMVAGHSLSFSPLTEGGELCSPRKLAISQGKLYVAEAGVGIETIPTDPSANGTDCVSNERFGPVCLGPTSRVSSYDLMGDKTLATTRTTVVDGLFSQRPLSGESEPHATGAHSICFDSDGESWYLVIGLGLNGTELSADGYETTIGAFGSVLRFVANSTTNGTIVAAPWTDEYANNYDDVLDPTGVLPVPDSNPYHIACAGDYHYVIDAGCNCIMKFNDLRTTDGTVPEPASVLVFPQFTQLPALNCPNVTPPFGPPFCGQYQLDIEGNATWLYDAEAVPTSVKLRPDVTDKVYVSTLVGALWTAPVAQIVEVTVDENGDFVEDSITPIAEGFHAVADFDFYGTDYLLVLETNPGTPTIPFSGRLTEVNLATGESEVIAEKELVAPTGILVYDGVVYISNDTYSAGDNQCQGHIIMAELPNEDEGETPTAAPASSPTSTASLIKKGAIQLAVSILASAIAFTQI